MEDYGSDNPVECARYAYNQAGERVAYVTQRIYDSAQQLGRDGRRHINLAEPPRYLSPSKYPGPLQEQMVKTLAVELMEWRHSDRPCTLFKNCAVDAALI